MATQAITTLTTNKTAQWAVEFDGLFCIGAGAIFLLASEPVSRFMGAQSQGVIAGLGVGTLIYGMVLLYMALKGLVNPQFLKGLITLDMMGAIGIVVLLAAVPDFLNTEGRWVVLIFADVAAALGIWKYVGMRRLNI